MENGKGAVALSCASIAVRGDASIAAQVRAASERTDVERLAEAIHWAYVTPLASVRAALVGAGIVGVAANVVAVAVEHVQEQRPSAVPASARAALVMAHRWAIDRGIDADAATSGEPVPSRDVDTIPVEAP